MVIDKNGIEVNQCDFIKFENSKIAHMVVMEYGELGCYEDYNFIGLKSTLKNFEIVNGGW